MEWVKGKALKFMEEANGRLFDDMLAEDGGHLWHKMISFLNDDILGSQDVSRRLFFLYKTYYEKLVHEELVAPEGGKNCEIYIEIYLALMQTIRNTPKKSGGIHIDCEISVFSHFRYCKFIRRNLIVTMRNNKTLLGLLAREEVG